MKTEHIINSLKKAGINPLVSCEPHCDELHLEVSLIDFSRACLILHKKLKSPIKTYFAEDCRETGGGYRLYCGFENRVSSKWVFLTISLPEVRGECVSVAKEIFSAGLFEREMAEMFGIVFQGSPDSRKLKLHPEVWPEGQYPLRKDFVYFKTEAPAKNFDHRRIDGEGVFEIPVGPVHAGIIGPGHFRFSVAGEPIINLEIRLGYTHRGAEKLFEGRAPEDCLKLAESVSGDSAFSYSLSFCRAVEKICSITVPGNAEYARGVFLELERMYNHIADIGAMALDVGFSFVSAYSSAVKETMLELAGNICGSRYLKGINRIGGVNICFDPDRKKMVTACLDGIIEDFYRIKKILFGSSSFLDRVDTTGIIIKNVGEDFGLSGVSGRAAGITRDLRQDFPGIYTDEGFKKTVYESGDALARMKVRIDEFEESARLVKCFMEKLSPAGDWYSADHNLRSGAALGYTESWRGPLLIWVRIDDNNRVTRCKITDPSFLNWQGLTFAVLGNIVPDFPVINKSFNLSYPGNDL